MNGGLSRWERTIEKMVEQAQKGKMSIQKVIYPGEVKRYSKTSNGFTVHVLSETSSSLHKLFTAEISWNNAFEKKEMSEEQKAYVNGKRENYTTQSTPAEMLYLMAMRVRKKS